jgi:hypothetical protein
MRAHKERLRGRTLDGIARQAGRHLPRLRDAQLARARSIELAESFAVWMLGADAVRRSDGKMLATLARDTQRWHHQIKHDGRARSYARSMPRGKTSHVLCELYVSPLAAKIDNALRWAERHLADTKQALLLNVPAYHVFALWLTDEAGEDRMVIVDAPLTACIKPLELLDAREFLAALRRMQAAPG